eukprot:SAG31_NODE_28352_length_411_cov_0.987179_1_plen_94_part_10
MPDDPWRGAMKHIRRSSSSARYWGQEWIVINLMELNCSFFWFAETIFVRSRSMDTLWPVCLRYADTSAHHYFTPSACAMSSSRKIESILIFDQN